ncbi:MAG: CoA pyrophosphatase, partial [Actinomycetota bacterium]|nr:CoA pyrophosphatase [Actinomycetota bacterium]
MPGFEQRLASVLKAHPPQRVTVPDARRAAVLIPVVAAPDPALIFTVRTETLPNHKGQISFPGGSIDPGDATARDAALRETEEELGLDPDLVRVLGELDTIPTFVSGYTVAPFVGWLDERPELQPNPAEVAQVLQVPITDLVEDIRREPGFEHGGRTYPTEAWVWHDHVIWGVTARIMRTFLGLLAEAGLTSPP